MKVLILAGGLGTRISEETNSKPKPMVQIGEKPVIWHIMKTYAFNGFNDFIILAGYKSDILKNYFSQLREPDWKIEILDTGEKSSKAMRIKMAEPFVKEDHFFVAYGDDVSDILPGNVLKTHIEKDNIATITVIPLYSEFGIVELNGKSKVTAFREKPRIANYWINGGYFCFSKEIFDYLGHDDEELEKEVFIRLSEERKLGAYIHEGFWKCMNTYKDKLEFEELINENRAPWIKW